MFTAQLPLSLYIYAYIEFDDDAGRYSLARVDATYI